MFKLSPEAAFDGAVTVENRFIVDYMPYADGDYVKVYLYGLSLAARKADPDDTVDRLARRLDLDRATVDAAIDYWSERGLMSRLGDDITYLTTRTARPKIKKYDVDLYAEFNRQAQLYISARQITPNEYNEYYALMEKLELEWQAMVLIVKYCVDLKGENVSCQYILAVARNLAEDGYRAYSDVENRLEEYGVYYNDLKQIMSALGGRRADHETVGLYKKWMRVYKFDKSVVLAVAKTIKKGGAATLDARLTGYRDLGLFSWEKIDAYETERKSMYALAKSVNKALGLYLENVDPEIAEYIRPWLDMGFEPAALVALADYCLKNNLKTLSDLDAVVRDFLAASAVTEAAVKLRVDRERRYDDKITALMKTLSLKGAVPAPARTYYGIWADKLGMPDDVIAYAAELARGKSNPFAYVNAVLSAWNGSDIKTLDAARSDGKTAEVAATSDADKKNTVVQRFSAEELDALITHLTDD